MTLGFYSWPKRCRHFGLIVAFFAFVFWIQQSTSNIKEWESVPSDPLTTSRIIEREILALDIAHQSNPVIQWYLGWDDRESTLDFYSSKLREVSHQTDETLKLQDEIDQRLAGNWPTPSDTSFLTKIFIATGFYFLCVLSAFVFLIHFWTKRDNPIHQPPLQWFSIGWVFMVFFIAELATKIILEKAYNLLYEHEVYAYSVYILVNGVMQSMVPFLVFAVSFSSWKHFKKKLFPDFKIHWRLIFFVLGWTYIISYLLNFLLPPSTQLIALGSNDPTLPELLYLFISLAIFAPIFEEITFRGFLFQGLRHKLGFFAAALSSSILFACVHVQYDWISMVYVGIMGFAACWVTLRTGSLTSAIILHALHNLWHFSFYYFLYQQPL